MSLKLYNTLTRKVEPLRPLNDNEVHMYTCGPTVYSFVHIGNFRTFMFQDILRRYLIYKGYRLLHVMNITDVEDKIIDAARNEGVSIEKYTRRYEEAFLQDMQTLRIQKPEVMPRATEHIEEMVKLILRLKDRSFTYESNGSIYFRISKFREYGKLSGLDPEELSEEGQIDEDEYAKENPRDFVLWKARKEGEAYWDTPLGAGRPGWHIECSAMSMRYLGDSFDIHCGGIDLVFPHHENEIAQSEGATEREFVRHWVHGAHLIVEGQKMSKSLGNFYTLRDLLDRGCNPLALRYLLFSVHYRKQLNFTFEGVEQSLAAIQRVNDFLVKVLEVPDEKPEDPGLGDAIKKARCEFEASMDDDLNTSGALGAVFELVRKGNLLLEEDLVGSENRDEILRFFRGVNQVFDVFQMEKPVLEDMQIESLIKEREEARNRRDFQRADQIRDQLAGEGIVLEDTRQGTRWKRQE